MRSGHGVAIQHDHELDGLPPKSGFVPRQPVQGIAINVTGTQECGRQGLDRILHCKGICEIPDRLGLSDWYDRR